MTVHIRFNMLEFVDDLVAEGCPKSKAIAMARQENIKRQKLTTESIRAKNNSLLARTLLIPKIFN